MLFVRSSNILGRVAWWPIPLLLVVIAGLWVADLRTVYESRALMVLLNLFFTWLASLCICFLTARGFLGSGQPALLMFGCGSLLWGVTSLTAAMVVDRVNATVTVHNLGVFGAALCHLAGLLWFGRLRRPGRWLVVGYAGALTVAALILWAATAGVTPPFFVQGHGGTPVRQGLLVLTVSLFAWVAWQLIDKFRRRSGAFCYWYGLGLALVATGLTGVLLLSVQGGLLGWTNRLTQYLGSVYLFIAAVAAARETGAWKLSLSAVEEAWLRKELLPALQHKQRLRFILRYGSAVLAVAAAYGLRLAVAGRFGPGFPPYVTFAPAAMAVALFAGFGPGLLALLLTDLVAGYWILPPVGQFAIASPVDRLGLLIYTGLALFICGIVELYRRTRDKAAAFDREAAAARYDLLSRHARDPLLRIETSGKIVEANQAALEFYGYSREALLELNIKDMRHGDDAETVERQMQEATAGGTLFETVHTCRGGKLVPVEVSSRGVTIEGRQMLLSVVRDVTERKAAEIALRASRERLDLALASARMATFDWDIVRNKRAWSDGVHGLLGTEANDFTGTSEEFFRVVHPEDRGAVETALAKAVETIGGFEAEYRAVWRDGSIHHISSRGKVHRDDAGRAVLMTGVCWDITDHKAADERLKASLREKEAMLKEIHHRVKNNMQVISSLVSLQADALKDPALRELFQNVRDRVRSMAMVHEKLYQSDSLACVEFGDYARSLLHYLWRAHGSDASGIRLNFDLQPVSLPIEAAVPCGLILNELAVNALKHAFRNRSSGEVTVTLRTDPDGKASLRVGDDGVGLPPGVDWRQSPSLGLRLVQMLASQLHGTVESGPGPGTEFRLSFGPLSP